MTRTEKLFEFNIALCKFSKLVENKRRLTKLEKQREECNTEFEKYQTAKEIKSITEETDILDQKVNEILKSVLQNEEDISKVEIDYNDIHVVERFQDYMYLI